MSNIIPFNPQEAAAILERLLAQGDLSRLGPQDRATYYMRVCHSVGLNPYTQPFAYIKFKDGKLKLYALKGCTDQLRKLHDISVMELAHSEFGGIFTVTARVATPDGRADQDIGSVCITGLVGEQLANAMMKAATKAKRRATLAICGLGLLDETEVDSIPGAERVEEDWKPWEPVEAPARRVVDNARRAISAPTTVVPSPKSRLRRDRTIDPRFEAVIKAGQHKPPKRYDPAEAAPPRTKPVLVYDEANPPPLDDIPPFLDRRPPR